ncbi:metal ion ABC transporter, permease [Sulfurihydrogenibium azorense Az-Fu1]|jgi:zinc/manganese transport system permease protein|uniref:Metal ion ABC transporter, permease n=1 Tax=Sulfurihydrogenibium azorense (strain DSM 15241 / OCM 825 / Az-Fu1) TaxID=204536 RepID=C1DUW3_SULAA|nr:metal ABC transporter permease [Sulfurihydrogenibium azorense]ACN98729.1 metal ion ABC transporter, permease [Sulfurihydrogenibium azorense Az-Fu1]
MIELLIPPILLSFVLLLIHSYYGLQIIKRNIIFTDLAIGQMAALGVAISLYLFGGKYLYPVSLLFAVFTALLIAYINHKEKSLQEAFIGLIYALGISGVFIVMSKSPHGLEELNNLLAYDILFTSYGDILKVSILYLFIGLVLYFFVRKIEGFLKDVLFFTTFAITLTSSVKLAGVLVVFSILIAPSLIALKLFNKNHILYATAVGSLLILISIILSYNFDLPTGYTIVFINTLSALATILFKK